MESTHIHFSEKVDLNAILNGGVADAGVVYEIPHVYADIISITTAGVVTPKMEGGAIILIKNATTGEEIDKVVLAIQPDGNDSLVIGIVTITNLVPAMTGYNTPSGVVTASAEFITDPVYKYPAWHAFDHASLAALGPTDRDDQFTWSSADGSTVYPQWIAYEFPASVIAHGYAVNARSQAAYLDMTPSAWTFEGSNDGTTWTVLDTQTAQTGWALRERRQYAISNSTTYLHYRLNISANNGSANGVNIAELEILG